MPNDNNNINYGLNICGNSPAAGTPVILYNWQGGQPNELWRLQSDGTIVSKLTYNDESPLPPSRVLYVANSSAVIAPPTDPPNVLDTWSTQDYVDSTTSKLTRLYPVPPLLENANC
jgi:hypothetical protein